VTLLYYSVGVIACTGFLNRRLLKVYKTEELQRIEVEPSDTHNLLRIKGKSKSLIILSMLGFLLIGLSVPIINHLPSQMPEESTPQIVQLAYETLISMEVLTPERWQEFLSNPQSMVVQGVAYHPRYYRSDVYAMGSLSFEMMLLTKQRVINSYMLGVNPTQYFSDGSNTILVGCVIGHDSMWAAERTVMQTYAIIQLDHEKSTYFRPDFHWTCK